jgi:hypothetical protein
MPTPNPDNPICQHQIIDPDTGEVKICGHYTTFNQTLPSGAREYRCRRHKPNYTVTDSDHPVGRQPIGDKAMSQAERDRRYRLSNPEKYREVHKRKSKKE